MAAKKRRFWEWGVVVFLAGLVASCGDVGDGTLGPGESSSGLQISNDATRLQNGDVQLLDFSSSTATVDLSDEAASYYLVVTSPARLRRSFSASLQNQSVKRMTDDPAAGDFHQYLRDMESVIAETEEEIEPSGSSAMKAQVVDPAIGSTREFKVLSTLGSISTYQTVTARLRRVSDISFVYVDVTVEEKNPDDLTDAGIENLGGDFDNVAVPWERSVFGSESDVDANGNKMVILMTPVLNQFQGTGGGIVTGFFFPGDVFAPSGSNPASNQMEIFYTLVPDHAGIYGVPMEVDFTLNNLLPGVLAHEYQHMISYNQHILERKASAEEPWLNESLSHLAEDLTGFGKENPSRVQVFLNSISTTSVVSSGSPNLAERGAEYLFMRYLYEQSSDPETFLKNLLQTSLTGIANLETAFAGPADFNEIGEFLQRWGVAVAVSGQGITSDPQFIFKDRVVHPQTGYFTGICLQCDPEDGRQTILTGPRVTTVSSTPASFSVPGTGVQILKVLNPATEITITGEADAALRGAIVRTSS